MNSPDTIEEILGTITKDLPSHVVGQLQEAGFTGDKTPDLLREGIYVLLRDPVKLKQLLLGCDPLTKGVIETRLRLLLVSAVPPKTLAAYTEEYGTFKAEVIRKAWHNDGPVIRVIQNLFAGRTGELDTFRGMLALRSSRFSPESEDGRISLSSHSIDIGTAACVDLCKDVTSLEGGRDLYILIEALIEKFPDKREAILKYLTNKNP